MRLAITGGTGFVGSHLIEQAVAVGHEVRALTRRAQPAMPGVEWIDGALDRPERLAALVDGTAAVIHVAGVVNGDREAFRIGNLLGTEAVLEAAAHAGVRRFVHVSSLAAREPRLSDYGWSKCAAEEPVIASGGNWTILRPPAIYGPRDRELLELFRIARLRAIPLPAHGRLSLIHVSDLCRLMLACLDSPASIGRIYEPDDGVPGGWAYKAFARALGDAIGRRVMPLPIPKALLGVGAWADTGIRGKRAKLTRDRVDYFCHPDWTASPALQPPAALWQPAIESRAGLAATAAWYRAQGWLGGADPVTKR